MKRAIWLCGLVAFAVAGCSDENGGGPGGPGGVDIEKTLIELVRADGVPANGSDTAIVRVVARDKDGKTISNRGVEARSSNPNDIVTIEPERTDKNGAAEIHVSATTVGERVLTISVQGLTMPQRPAVRFVPGDGTYLEFIEAPTVGKAGRPLRPAVRVEVKDQRGNRVVDSSEEISLHVGDSITLTEKAERGVATFADVVIEEPGEGHRLRATGPGMQEALSDEIDIIVGDPAHLTFERQPVDTEVGGQLSVSVAVRDPAGNVVVGSNETIRIRLYSNPTGANLEGTLVAQAEEGIATFDGLQINKGSAGYQLTAAASGYQSAISDAFAIGSIDPDSDSSTFVIRPNGDDEEPTALANGQEWLRIEGRLFDAHGNALAGVPVTLSASGEGHRFHPSEEGEGRVLELPTTAAGSISAWISSTTAEVKTVTMRVGELFEKTATATFVPGVVAPATTELVPQAVTAVVDVDRPTGGENGGIRFDVLARDAEDNPVPGMTASITASGSENKIENRAGTEISFVTTDGDGVASFWFKSMRAEEKTVTVRIGDVTLSRDVTFLPGTPDRSVSTIVSSSLGQSGTVGTDIDPFVVEVRDRYGNLVPGAQVSFAIEKNNGQIVSTPVTAEGGVAEATLTLGTESGENVVSWHAGWDGDPRADLTAIGIPDVPHTLRVLTDVTDLSATAGGPGSISLQFEARDVYENVTGGPAYIDFTGDGSFPAEKVIPPWSLGASPSVTIDWVLKEEAGANALTASLRGTSSEIVIDATGEAGAPSQILIPGDDSFDLDVNEGPVKMEVLVLDENDNPVDSTVAVRFAIDGFADADADGRFAEGGTAGPPDGDHVIIGGTDDSGLRAANYSAGTDSGTKTITASVEGFSSVATTFTVNVGPAAADKMEKAGGDGQEGNVGKALDDELQVLVTDVYDNPVSGVTVTFSLTDQPAGSNGGLGEDGDQASLSDTTGDDGIASVPFSLGDLPGPYEVTATATDLNTLTFTATAEVGAPDEIVIVSGDGQVGIVNEALDHPLVVRVSDEKGNLLEDVTVDFSGTSGIQLSESAPKTNSSGEATVDVTKLPQQAGEVEVVASVGALEVTFEFVAEAGAPASIAYVSGRDASGVWQVGTVGMKLDDALVVRVDDGYGNPKPGAKVEFKTAPGGQGLFYEDDEDEDGAEPAVVVTDTDGEASVLWELPTSPGIYNATAIVLDDDDNQIVSAGTVPFVANAELGPPAQLQVTVSDDGEAPVGGSVVVDVKVLDHVDNPLDGVQVDFTLPSGQHGAGLSVPSATTAGGGLAKVTVQMGTAPVAFQLDIAAGAVSTSVDLETLVGPPDEIVAVSGAGETAQTGTDLPIVVRVEDAYDNPVEGVNVSFAPVNAGDGVFNPVPAPTNDQGEATSTWTLPVAPGTYDATATTADGKVLNFSVTAEAGVATLLPTPSGEVDATVGDQVAISVEARDAQDLPIDGSDVEFVVLSGDASLDQPSVTTAGGGQAGNQVNLGNAAGRVEVKAFVGSIEALFVVNAGADVADTIAVETGDGQSGLEGVALAEALVVRVTDRHGNPVEGEDVTFASADGTASPDVVSTDADGLASTSFTPEAVGPITVSATIASGTTTQADFAVTGLEAPAAFELVAGDRQRINTEARFSNPVVVRALDQNDDPVEGAAVSFTVTDGALVSADAETDADGYATAYVEALATAGDVTVVASLDDFGALGNVSFDLVAEDEAVCHAAGSTVYYLDAASVLQSHDWVDGAGIYKAAEDTANGEVAYVDFSEAVAGEPAFGFVHTAIHLDCSGEQVAIVADAAGATISIDGTPADWTVPTGTATYSLDPTTGAFSVSCPGGVGVQGYDDGLDHFTRVAAIGAAGASFCADPPVAVEMTP